MAKGVWIVAEVRDGAYRKVSFEIASAARKLADELGDEVCAVLCGSGIEGKAAELGKYGVDKVYVADNAALEPYTTDAHAMAVAKIVKRRAPQSCCWQPLSRARTSRQGSWGNWPQGWPRTAPASRSRAASLSPCGPCTRASASAKWPSRPPPPWRRCAPTCSPSRRMPRPAPWRSLTRHSMQARKDQGCRDRQGRERQDRTHRGRHHRFRRPRHEGP